MPTELFFPTRDQELECRVTEVKEDGKLSLSARGKAYEQIAIDAESVLSVIEEFAGVLPFDDKASPEVIQREFGLSKAAFKRAVVQTDICSLHEYLSDAVFLNVRGVLAERSFHAR